MTGYDLYCTNNFGDLSDLERWAFLVRQNAYYIWERRAAAGQPGTPEADWAAAEAFVAEGWSARFSPKFLESWKLPGVPAPSVS